MAIQFASVGDLLFRLAASGLPGRLPLTHCLFVRCDADSGAVGPVVVRYGDAAGTVRQALNLDSSGATNLLQAEAQSSGGSSPGVALTIGTWYPAAITVAMNGAVVEVSLYVNGVFVESVSGADIADTSASMAVGSTGANLPKLSVARWKLWTSVLTPTEILAEAGSLAPVKAGPWAYYAFASGALTTDSSGNGRSLTSNGTPVFVADPVIGGTIVTPGAGSAAFTGLAPTAVRTDNRTAAPGAGSAAITGLAPFALRGTIVQPPAGAASFTGLAPALLQNLIKQVPAGAASFTGLVPAVVVSDVHVVAPGVGQATITGLAPTVVVGDSHVVAPGAGQAALTGAAPLVLVSDNRTAQPGAGAATFTGLAPTVAVTNGQTAQPGAGAMALSGLAPVVAVSDQQVVQPGAGALAFTGLAPTVKNGDAVVVQPGAGQLAFTGLAPTVIAPITAQPGAGALSFSGLAPTARVQPINPPSPSTNPLDPKYLGRGKKWKNLGFKGNEAPAAPAVHVVKRPAAKVPAAPAAPKPRASGLMLALLDRAAPQVQAEPVKSAATVAQVPAIARTPAPPPYVSDLDPFYEPAPEPVAAAPAESQLAGRIDELAALVQSLQAEIESLKRKPYQSDLEPFYEPELPQVQAISQVRRSVQDENRRRAEVLARQLLQ